MIFWEPRARQPPRVKSKGPPELQAPPPVFCCSWNIMVGFGASRSRRQEPRAVVRPGRTHTAVLGADGNLQRAQTPGQSAGLVSQWSRRGQSGPPSLPHLLGVKQRPVLGSGQVPQGHTGWVARQVVGLWTHSPEAAFPGHRWLVAHRRDPGWATGVHCMAPGGLASPQAVSEGHPALEF